MIVSNIFSRRIFEKSFGLWVWKMNRRGASLKCTFLVSFFRSKGFRMSRITARFVCQTLNCVKSMRARGFSISISVSSASKQIEKPKAITEKFLTVRTGGQSNSSKSFFVFGACHENVLRDNTIASWENALERWEAFKCSGCGDTHRGMSGTHVATHYKVFKCLILRLF